MHSLAFCISPADPARSRSFLEGKLPARGSNVYSSIDHCLTKNEMSALEVTLLLGILVVSQPSPSLSHPQCLDFQPPYEDPQVDLFSLDI